MIVAHLTSLDGCKFVKYQMIYYSTKVPLITSSILVTVSANTHTYHEELDDMESIAG
jgi:hypothetical protein